MPDSIRSAMGWNTSFAMSVTASRGVKCSPALLVVLLVEAPDQFLEDGSHAVVVEAGVPDRAVGVHHRIGTQVDVR